MTVSDAFAAYDVDVLYASGKALKTRRNYRSCMRSFLNACDTDLPVQLITYNSIVQWEMYMSRHGIQPSTVSHRLGHLAQVLKYLKKHGQDVIDYRDIERPKIPKKKYTWLDNQEISDFLGVIDSPRDKAIFACLFSSGARISELLQLDRDSITISKNGDATAEIIGKGDKEGTLSFDDNCLKILDAYLDTRTDRLRPLFISGQRRRITVSRVEQLCHEYADMAGINKNVTPHVFRHSFATHLVLNGADLYATKTQLRHSQLATTMRYVHAESSKQENYRRYHTPVPLS